MAACNSKRRAAYLHVRTRDLACIDGIAQVYVGVPASANVTHRSDTGEKRRAGVGYASDSFTCIGAGELVIGIEIGIAGEMRVHIDQSGHNRQATKVDNVIAG